jgi:formylglycine-generating enzyme required for sulfatase activity
MSYNFKFNYLQDRLEELENRMIKIKVKSLISNISLQTLKLMEPLIKKNITGYEKNIPKLPSNIWYFGHICYILEKYCYLVLDEIELDNSMNNNLLFDFRYISISETYEKKMSNINLIYNCYIEIIGKLHNWLDKNRISPLIRKIIERVFFYNSLINERIYEAYKFANINFENYSEFEITKNQKLNYIPIIGGTFNQGLNKGELFVEDNQCPSFKKTVKSFHISDSLVTEKMYLEFINSNGYYLKKYWSELGWDWKEKNKINGPLYWFKIGKNWYKKQNNKNILIDKNLNHPVTHVSLYEASAYCFWANGRLPTEEEWEYTATNRGTTYFPWGTNKLTPYSSNSNKSLLNINQLLGNVHQWCLDAYLPYDNYTSDNLNPSIFYNNFDPRKAVLKGGSYLTSPYFQSPQYRLGAFPEDRHILNGFRVVKTKENYFKESISEKKNDYQNDLSLITHNMISDLIKKEIILKESLESILLIDDEEYDNDSLKDSDNNSLEDIDNNSFEKFLDKQPIDYDEDLNLEDEDINLEDEDINLEDEELNLEDEDLILEDEDINLEDEEFEEEYLDEEDLEIYEEFNTDDDSLNEDKILVKNLPNSDTDSDED